MSVLSLIVRKEVFEPRHVHSVADFWTLSFQLLIVYDIYDSELFLSRSIVNTNYYTFSMTVTFGEAFQRGPLEKNYLNPVPGIL